MNRLHVSLIGALLLAAACGELEGVLAVSKAIGEKYHMPASVNINNGSHLSITFQNAAVESLKLDSAGMDSFARDVAAFARAKYPRAAELEDVTVQFATTSSSGVLVMTRGDAPHRFRASELP